MSYLASAADKAVATTQTFIANVDAPIFDAGTTGLVITKSLETRLGVSGALTSITFTSGTAQQVSTASDTALSIPIDYLPTGATSASSSIEISPDNVTYSLIEATQIGPYAAGGVVTAITSTVYVPLGWYVLVTVNANATILNGTFY